ncbi:MAG: 2-succinyl-6-hydroxy-2,4-cyclohexadiene-1-carboxylate synthase [Chlamydiae bacterium]|nr:2-succinyl-6-hydroxy-2,4-cyclohexadiene-1-carboxylate synthase [Chlamydiota bacterium]
MLFRREFGSKNKPTLILLHGFLGTHQDFSTLIPYLKEDFYCVCFDLPGHGKSKQLQYTNYDSLEEIILRDIEPYSNASSSLLGYSMGGRIALNIFNRLNCSKLILISTRIDPLSKEEKDERALFEKKWATTLLKDSFSNFLITWYSQPLFCTLKENPLLLKKIMSKRFNEDPKFLAKAFLALSPCNLLPHFDSKKPLLYLTGSKDLKYASIAKKLEQNSNQIFVHSHPTSSHAVHLEAPEFTANQITTFHRYFYDRMENSTSI